VHWWVFGLREHSWRRLIEFHATALTAEVVTLVVTNALVYGPTAEYFATGIGPYAAKIIGTGAAFAWTFGSSFFWIWRPSRNTAGGTREGSGTPAGRVGRRQITDLAG
jgi:putative flippase GtrA